MADFRMGVDAGAVGDLWNRFAGNRPEDYVKSPEFLEQVLMGFKQLSSGEEPRGLIEAQNALVNKGWGPKTSAGYVSGLLQHLEQATQNKTRNAILQENAAVPPQMRTEANSPADRDSMEQAGFEPTDTTSRLMPGRAERSMTPNQYMRLAPNEAWKNPAVVGQFMQVPQEQALTEARTADVESQTRTRQALQRLEDLKEETLRGLSTERGAGGEPSMRELALSPGLAQLFPQREKAADPLEEQRRKLLEAQATESGARAGYYRERDRSAGRAGSESETTSDRVLAPDKQVLAERAIAKMAEGRGVASLPADQQAAALRQIADDFGFELAGTPSLSVPGVMSKLGAKLTPGGEAATTLTGEFSLRPKPVTKTTTRGPARGPAGQPAARQSNQPGKSLDAQTAAAYLKQAGGDKQKARALARAAGYTF